MMIKALVVDFTNVLYQPFAPSEPINQELLNFIKQQDELNCYVFSASSPQVLADYRSQLIPPLTELISSKELGLSKYKVQTYQTLAERLKIKPAEILFVDDKLENVNAARDAGCQVIHFQETEQFLRRVEEYL